jgi:hypothetical protein
MPTNLHVVITYFLIVLGVVFPIEYKKRYEAIKHRESTWRFGRASVLVVKRLVTILRLAVSKSSIMERNV